MRQVFVRKTRENPKYTHTLAAMNERNVIVKRILYDQNTSSVFKNNERNMQTKTQINWNRVETDDLMQIHRDEMIRLITGGLRWSIDNHGVIDNKKINSAAKRITSVIFDFLGVRTSHRTKDGRQRTYSNVKDYI